MKKYCLTLLVACLFLLINTGCKTQSPAVVMQKSFPDFYKEGHRGARGLMPENTIPGMYKAVDAGANILEVDVYITKDQQVVITHDPYVNPNYMLLPTGEEIPKEEAKKYVLHQMNYADIRQFDVGSKPYPAFPQQQKLKTYMPLLGELIDSVDNYTAAKKLKPVIYNIEIKANPQYDGVYQPEPATLVRKVMEVVNSRKLPNSRFYIQSFDIRQIQEVHRSYPEVIIGFLTDKKEMTFEQNLEQIGFQPHIYSPHYKLVTAELVQKCHARGIKCVPWTVNDLAEMKTLQALGVDGIITDYPNYFSQLNY
ncbi:glycerophosphodiester phosphodiesterase family protein [Adhaeribacter aerolatus]|nr:glycerophosphodiester phosphodiesterase family protein [Adhaeribacter aerolatus]